MVGIKSSKARRTEGSPLTQAGRTTQNTSMAVLDTLKAAKALKQAGFDDAQAEAVVATVGDAIGEHVTKTDLEPLATKAEVADLRASMQAEMAGLRAEMADLRSATKTEIAGLRADLYRALWLQAAGIIGLTVAILRFLG